MARVLPIDDQCVDDAVEQSMAKNYHVSREQCKLNAQMWHCFVSWQRKPGDASLEKKFQAVVNRGADLLSTNPTQHWYFTPLHQAAYAGNPLIIRRLISILQEKGLLQANLRTESHPRGLGEHGYPVELARRSSEIATLLRNASEWKFRQRMATLMLCIASHNAYALTPQARGSVSVIGLLYREWAAMKRIMQYILPQFAIGDVVRAEITIDHQAKFLYASIRQRRRQDYMVVYHAEDKQEHHQRRPSITISNTALRSANQLCPERFDPTRYKHQLEAGWTNSRSSNRGSKIDIRLSKACEGIRWIICIFFLAVFIGPIVYQCMTGKETGKDCPISRLKYSNMTRMECNCVVCEYKINRFVVVDECSRGYQCMAPHGECRLPHKASASKNQPVHVSEQRTKYIRGSSLVNSTGIA